MPSEAPTLTVSVIQEAAWLLLGAAILGVAARHVHVPYAVVLVLGAILVEQSHLFAVPVIDPSVVLFAFLPPLLFDASFRLDTAEVRRHWRPVAVLAFPGTVVTALVVGVIVTLVLRLPPGVGLLFGSLVAATDPVAVLGVFRHLHAPGRVSAIVEAESLVNDGVAITLYVALLGFATSGQFNVLDTVLVFGREVLIGLGVGIALGLIFSRLTAIVDDHLIEMTLSTALAYGSFLVADSLQASGALACVAAGFVHGSYGRAVGMSARTSRLLDDLWEYLGFATNAVVFLLVGFSAPLGELWSAAGYVAIAVDAVLVARLFVAVAPGWLVPSHYLVTTSAERLVLFWGGLRGALTVTLALALPPAVPHRDLLVTLAFGVVLFTLVVQGTSLSWLLRRLKLASDE